MLSLTNTVLALFSGLLIAWGLAPSPSPSRVPNPNPLLLSQLDHLQAQVASLSSDLSSQREAARLLAEENTQLRSLPVPSSADPPPAQVSTAPSACGPSGCSVPQSTQYTSTVPQRSGLFSRWRSRRSR